MLRNAFGSIGIIIFGTIEKYVKKVHLCHYKLRKWQTLNIISSGRKPIVRIVMKQKLGIQNENSTVQIIWINYLMILNIKEANETKSQKGNGLYNTCILL